MNGTVTAVPETGGPAPAPGGPARVRRRHRRASARHRQPHRRRPDKTFVIGVVVVIAALAVIAGRAGLPGAVRPAPAPGIIVVGRDPNCGQTGAGFHIADDRRPDRHAVVAARQARHRQFLGELVRALPRRVSPARLRLPEVFGGRPPDRGRDPRRRPANGDRLCQELRRDMAAAGSQPDGLEGVRATRSCRSAITSIATASSVRSATARRRPVSSTTQIKQIL